MARTLPPGITPEIAARIHALDMAGAAYSAASGAVDAAEAAGPAAAAALPEIRQAADIARAAYTRCSDACEARRDPARADIERAAWAAAAAWDRFARAIGSGC